MINQDSAGHFFFKMCDSLKNSGMQSSNIPAILWLNFHEKNRKTSGMQNGRMQTSNKLYCLWLNFHEKNQKCLFCYMAIHVLPSCAYAWHTSAYSCTHLDLVYAHFMINC